MAPARAGSFNANFSPETLESFKNLCRDQSRQYTKVLERLAELYLGSQGSILEAQEEGEISQNSKSLRIEKLVESVEQLETVMTIQREDYEEVVRQLKTLEERLSRLEGKVIG